MMITRLAWREADAMTANQMFQLLDGIFFAALLLMLLIRKIEMAKNSADHYAHSCPPGHGVG